VVDILKGAHYEPAYSKINPNHLIPMLEDGDFRLTESAAILRYLAEKIDSPAFPKDIKQRARVNEVMDWFNSNFYRDWGYGLIYPQLFPHLKREDAKVQEAVVAYGKEKYLVGNQLTIADYFGAAITTAGELVHCDFSAYPNIKRWLDTFKAGPNYAKVYETFNGFVASTKGQPWQAI
jgi:glutathione S-transferase